MASSSQARRPAKASAEEPPLRILCFGNSLTFGYPESHPYAEVLAQKIEEAFPGRKVECEVEGVPGDFVVDGKYLSRMQASWRLAQHPYDWTIVLGGTNDIGWSKPPNRIIEGLKRVWDIPLSKGSKVLALTIPETKWRHPTAIVRRDQVNSGIKSYERENFFHFDLFKAIPYHVMSPEDRDKYWDPDGVHLTAAGYDLMGEKIGDALVRILRLAEAQGTDISSVVWDARQRKAIEDLIFEEEMGDPRLLSQGYIIVRKKDLD
ncbi:putative GDSL-like lipase [Rosellinia necatrix]|uniref:Putative GDSL-like lipase n=1 Tax=Rosellinia necatrix TaxID=77044 RepID=A0A1W2TBC7_ROSNE|nr:putative GDSL-like lipase [Rosellinia necatrix]